MLIKTEDLDDYLIDASNMSGGNAEKLFIPTTPKGISEILHIANEVNVGVTVSGARTGTVGGAIPFGGYLISLEKFNKIKEINDKFAVVGSGVILQDLQKAVEAKKLFYPPDPTEWSCQIGGNVATNASGARSFKYGATREFVERIEIVLPDGELLSLKRGEVFADKKGNLDLTTVSGKKISLKIPSYKTPKVRKNVSGYFTAERMDAIDLFIGSEGTLGIITEIQLKLLPQPESFFSGIVFFNDENHLLDFVREARELSFNNRSETERHQTLDKSKIDATLLEYFDENSLVFISKKFPNVPENAKCAIFFEQEATEETEDELLSQWLELLEKHQADVENSWFTTTENDRNKMREFRHSLPMSVNEWLVHHKQRKVGTDMAVPDENFLNILKFYRKTLAEFDLNYVIFGHIGDNHLHVNILPKDAEDAVKAKHVYGRFIAQTLMLGGTVSAEHGIGKLKKHYLYTMFGERYLNEMAEIKKQFDPQGILNRGNMFDEKFLF